MSSFQKFDFNLSFDEQESRDPDGFIPAEADIPRPTIVEVEPVIIETPPPPPRISPEDLEEARRLAYEEGLRAGEEAALGRSEVQLAGMAENLTEAFGGVQQTQRTALGRIERHAATLLVSSLRKLFPVLVERAGTDELEVLVNDALSLALDEPRLVVRCAAAMTEPMGDLMRDAAARAGYEGKISILSDPRMQTTDCRIEWAEGGVERDPRAVLDEIEASARRAFDAFDQRLRAREEAEGAEGLGERHER